MTSRRESSLHPETSLKVHCAFNQHPGKILDNPSHPESKRASKNNQTSVTSLLQTRKVIRSVMSSTPSFNLNHHHQSFNFDNNCCSSNNRDMEIDNIVPSSLVIHPSHSSFKNYDWVIPHVPVPGSYRSMIHVNYNENTLSPPKTMTSYPSSSSPSTSSDNISRSPSGSFCSRSTGSQDLPANRIKLQWKDLSFRISQSEWKRKPGSVLPSIVKTPKEILQPQSGELVGGTITALMGPSGAGMLELFGLWSSVFLFSIYWILDNCDIITMTIPNNYLIIVAFCWVTVVLRSSLTKFNVNLSLFCGWLSFWLFLSRINLPLSMSSCQCNVLRRMSEPFLEVQFYNLYRSIMASLFLWKSVYLLSLPSGDLLTHLSLQRRRPCLHEAHVDSSLQNVKNSLHVNSSSLFENDFWRLPLILGKNSC